MAANRPSGHLSGGKFTTSHTTVIPAASLPALAAARLDCYQRQLITLSGPQVIRRAYYYCQEYRRGFCPLDAQIGIGRGQCSVSVC